MFYSRAGTRWAQLRVTGPHSSSPAYVDLSSGALSRGAGSNRTRSADLDAPHLVRRLCAPLRRPLVPPNDTPGVVPGELVLSGRRAGSVSYSDAETVQSTGRVLLQQCGKKEQTIRRCVRVVCDEVVLDDKVLAWVETDRSRGTVATIRIRSLKTGRTRSVQRRGDVQLVLLRHELFAATNGRLEQISQGPREPMR